MSNRHGVVHSRLIDGDKIHQLIDTGFQAHLIEGAEKHIESIGIKNKRTTLTAMDGEVILKYHASKSNPSGIYLITGKGVDHEEMRSLIAFYMLSRIESPIRSELEPCFFEELQHRNYDISTFKLKLNKNHTAHKKIGTPRNKPKQLKLQYGKLPDQKEDTCILWGEGCSSSDGHLLMYHFSSLLYVGLTGTWSDKLVDVFESMGFNIKTLKFSIEKSSL